MPESAIDRLLFTFRAFSWALSIDGKVPLADGLEHPDLPGTSRGVPAWLTACRNTVIK